MASMRRPVRLRDRIHDDVVVLDETDVFTVGEEVETSTRSLLFKVAFIIVVALLQDHVIGMDEAGGAVHVAMAHIAALILAIRHEAAVVAIVSHLLTLSH